MLSHEAKQVFYLLLGPCMSLNGFLYRAFRAPRESGQKVHLGPGKKKYLDGWINVDANIFTGKADAWADLRNKLPFHDNTIQAIYSHHMIEHLPDMAFHFREAFRCLQPGGVYRVGGPNGDSAIRKYVENDPSWFTDFPDKRKSIGGKLENFLFLRREHLTILTYSYLEELMTDAGFTNLRVCLPTKETHYPELFSPCLEKEYENDFDYPYTLIIEAEKPQ